MEDADAPKLGDIKSEHYGFMKFKKIPWFPEAANHSGLVEGGIYLLSGPPGGGKTTLALQISADLAALGHKVLYISLEQPASQLKDKIDRQVFPSRRPDRSSFEQGLSDAKRYLKSKSETKSDEERIYQNLVIDTSPTGMESLPDFLARHVLGAAPYSGTALIVVDSIQGLGTVPTSSKPYQRLFEFNHWAKEHGITALLIGHITKGGAIAGPRSLEHNVDCVLYLRKAMRLRPLFVPKNRFGPERYEPLTLVMDEHGCLEKSKHVKARASHTFGLLPGASGSDLIEVQALVKLPKYGDKPGIKAPYLPKQKLSQLLGIVSSLHEIDISDLTFEINCALPGGRPYRVTLDLPLAISMLSSYFQRQLSPGSLFIGELDLFQNIRPIEPSTCASLIEALTPYEGSPLAHCVSHIYLPEVNVENIKKALSEKGLQPQVHGLQNLEDTIKTLWPDII